MKIKSIIFVVLLALSGLVVGCASEPTEAEMRVVFDQHMADMIAKGGEMRGMFKPEIHSVKKLECKDAPGGDGFYCDYELDYTSPFGREKKTDTGHFTKKDGEWTAKVVKK